MSLEQNLVAFAEAVGLDIKALVAARGDLALLTTTEKTNLVAAINEIQAIVASVETDLIDDLTVQVDRTWSSTKISDAIATAKSEIINGAPAAYDTLQEIAAYLTANDGAMDALLTSINNRVRFDAAQTLTTAEQLQACTNIGVGDPEVDLVAAYTTAKTAV